MHRLGRRANTKLAIVALAIACAFVAVLLQTPEDSESRETLPVTGIHGLSIESSRDGEEHTEGAVENLSGDRTALSDSTRPSNDENDQPCPGLDGTLALVGGAPPPSAELKLMSYNPLDMLEIRELAVDVRFGYWTCNIPEECVRWPHWIEGVNIEGRSVRVIDPIGEFRPIAPCRVSVVCEALPVRRIVVYQGQATVHATAVLLRRLAPSDRWREHPGFDHSAVEITGSFESPIDLGGIPGIASWGKEGVRLLIGAEGFAWKNVYTTLDSADDIIVELTPQAAVVLDFGHMPPPTFMAITRLDGPNIRRVVTTPLPGNIRTRIEGLAEGSYSLLFWDGDPRLGSPTLLRTVDVEVASGSESTIEW